MKNRFVLLLAALAALGCSTVKTTTMSDDLTDRPEVQCTPDLEGMFVAGSDGAWFNVPLRGSIHLRFADGQVLPATAAFIERADQPCPHNDRRTLTISRDGRFETPFTLLTDAHWFCKDGELVKKETVETIHLQWEASGVYGYARPGNSELHGLAFVLDPSSNDRHWCRSGTVTLSVNGVAIDLHTGAGKLKRAGFKHDDIWWEQYENPFHLILDDIVQGTLRELEVDVANKP